MLNAKKIAHCQDSIGIQEEINQLSGQEKWKSRAQTNMRKERFRRSKIVEEDER
jgi:hypothetical protein